ncbi:MAG TPA: hypothetical protein VJY64_03475 [Candidatus Onthovivens sp.]|nr:hypothetical protein [Candidatus Onthovivens sp.]
MYYFIDEDAIKIKDPNYIYLVLGIIGMMIIIFVIFLIFTLIRTKRLKTMHKDEMYIVYFKMILKALGEKNNILEHKIKATKIKVTLKDLSLLDQVTLKKFGAESFSVKEQVVTIKGTNMTLIEEAFDEIK